MSTPTGDWWGEAVHGMLTGETRIPYEQRLVARDEVGGVTVSTCWTDDFGWETAILDEDNAYPVERYPSRGQALTGHAAWVVQAPALITVLRLGTGDGEIEDEWVTLRRGL